MRMIAALLVVLAIIALVASLLLADFTSRSAMPDPNADLPRTAIVFTGQFDRIERALDMLTAGHFDRLFISGVNQGAGLGVDRFAEQFELTTRQANWIASGRIVLAPDANSTLENARETACWLQRRPHLTAVTLISSQTHMARASLALQRAIMPVRVIRLPSDPSDQAPGVRAQLPEFRKFLTTWAMTLLPSTLWPVDEPALCRSG